LGRTNIAIDDSVADELSQEASRENKTQFALANEALMAVMEVTRGGGDPKQVYPSWKFVSMMKDVGCLVLPEDLVEKLVTRMFGVDKDWLLKVWYDEGSRLGNFLRMSATNPEELGGVIEQFQVLLPAQKIELKRLASSTEEDKSGFGHASFEIRAIGTGNSLEATNCADQFIRGLLSSYSLVVTDSRIARGIIDIKAVSSLEKSSSSM